MKNLEINGKVYGLRIYSKFVAGVQEKLPAETPFAEAIMSASTDPVKYAVPFLWGIIQDRKSDELVPYDQAFDLYDDLVDAGYKGFKISELLTDICEASGFFDDSGAASVRAALKKVKEITDQAGQNLLKKVGGTKQTVAPKASTTSRKR